MKVPRRRARILPNAGQQCVAQQHPKFWLIGSFVGPCLGPSQGPFSWSPRHRSQTCLPFECQATRRNSQYWISPSNHPLEHHYKTLRHTSSTSTSFRTSWTFLDVWPPSTSKFHILPKNTIINHFMTLKHHDKSVTLKLNLAHCEGRYTIVPNKPWDFWRKKVETFFLKNCSLKVRGNPLFIANNSSMNRC